MKIRLVKAIAVFVIALVPFAGVPPDDSVADAAMRGDLATVRSLLKGGADVNEAQGDGMTAIHWSAYNGDVDMANVLLYAGARANSLTRLGGYTPLHLGSRGGHAEVVKVLLEAGADANAATSTGQATPLHFAAASGNVDAIVSLVEHSADVNVAESQWGHTPLMFAAANNRARAIGALIHLGADPAIAASVIDMRRRQEIDREALRDKEARLGLAPGSYNSQSARIPSQAQPAGGQPSGQGAGAPPPSREAPPDASAAQRSAAKGGQEYFGVTAMSTPEQIGGYGGMTALTLAGRDGNVEAAISLLEGGADVNQGTEGDNTTPLLIATINGEFDLAMMLLERGADPRIGSDSGNTPLFATIHGQWAPMSRFPMPSEHLRQETSYLEMMEALLSAGADVNVRLNYNVWYMELGSGQLGVDWVGATLFLRAAHGTDVEAMKLLVRYGADPDIPTVKTEGRRRGRRGGRGVPAPSPDDPPDPSGIPPVPVGGPGIYPIHAASGSGHGYGLVGNVHRHHPGGWLRAVRYLVEELGADVNARDSRGDTPLHNAASRGDNELILYLIEKGADVLALNRKGQTTADMANGPTQRIEPFPETIGLLVSLGATNNHNCISC